MIIIKLFKIKDKLIIIYGTYSQDMAWKIIDYAFEKTDRSKILVSKRKLTKHFIIEEGK
jgi:hypothetical protein